MNLSLSCGHLRIELTWFEQLWAFTLHKTIDIPLNHIRRVTTEKPEFHWAEIRAPGTFLPGVIKAGTYYTRQGREFWYVTRDSSFLVLELSNEFYKRIILTLDNSEAWLNQLNVRASD